MARVKNMWKNLSHEEKKKFGDKIEGGGDKNEDVDNQVLSQETSVVVYNNTNKATSYLANQSRQIEKRATMPLQAVSNAQLGEIEVFIQASAAMWVKAGKMKNPLILVGPPPKRSPRQKDPRRWRCCHLFLASLANSRTV